MPTDAARSIRIAAALIEDGAGRLLLLRKAGARWFMQPGGKIEAGETVLAALLRELKEELGLSLPNIALPYLGQHIAPAANEPNMMVVAELFHLRLRDMPETGAEIEEAVWVDEEEALALPLAPLTRDCVLPLFEAL
ncbi:MAG: NUDIX domain-containing protein [Sphingobium sp.]|nr:NUDIX domain-containing protein [Sphingobium sp.]